MKTVIVIAAILLILAGVAFVGFDGAGMLPFALLVLAAVLAMYLLRARPPARH